MVRTECAYAASILYVTYVTYVRNVLTPLLYYYVTYVLLCSIVLYIRPYHVLKWFTLGIIGAVKVG